MIVITKEFIPSFSLIENETYDELNKLINLLKNLITEKFKKVSIFEHGMCACIGGLDRAHLHMMSILKHNQ